jgi:hypothetical protein
MLSITEADAAKPAVFNLLENNSICSSDAERINLHFIKMNVIKLYECFSGSYLTN